MKKANEFLVVTVLLFLLGWGTSIKVTNAWQADDLEQERNQLLMEPQNTPKKYLLNLINIFRSTKFGLN